jgi:hypothetical protein
MFCERCGTKIEVYNAGQQSYCPVCGSMLKSQQHIYSGSPPIHHEPYHYQPIQTEAWQTHANPYEQGYHGQQRAAQNPLPPNNAWNTHYDKSVGYNSHTTTTPQHQPLPPYAASRNTSQPVYIVSNKNDSALITEIILSLFGIFGVGWLVGKETVIGIVLLLTSIFIYWPVMILGTVLTFGVGLICLGPLAIAAIIINVVLLNSRLKKKAMHFVVTPSQPVMPPPMTMPPQF